MDETPPAARAYCPWCWREIALTKAGRLRRHGTKDGSWPPKDCDGAGQLPTRNEEER